MQARSVLQNRYQIEAMLGQGGMGTVFLARDRRLDKYCAVKEMLDVSPQALQQFGHEARLLARLHHSHLPRVTDYFAQTGRYYLVMDYVEGTDLDTWVRQRGPIPLSQALAWAAQMLDALDYLHCQVPPVIHRDVKPANVKVTPDGQAFLVDFGIAKVHRPGQYTQTGAHAYTPGYAPLEQYAAHGQTDARTDIYGLGATLYYVLAGVPPVDALDRAAGGRLPALLEANPRVTVPRDVEAVVNRALALNKQDRWPSAKELRRALAETGARPTPLPSAPSSVPAGPGRHRSLWILAATAVLLVIVLGLLALSLASQGDHSLHYPPATKVALAASPPARISPTEVTLIDTSTPGMTTTEPAEKPTSVARALDMGTATLIPTLVSTTSVPTQPLSTPTPTLPRPTETPRVSASPRPTSTPSPQAKYPAPVLVNPERDASLRGIALFKWTYSGPPLRPDQAFDVRIWSVEHESALPSDQRRGVVAPTSATEVEINLDGAPATKQYGGGEYYWTVVVVQLSACSPSCPPVIVGEWGEERSFTYTPSGSPGQRKPTPEDNTNPEPPPPDH